MPNVQVQELTSEEVLDFLRRATDNVPYMADAFHDARGLLNRWLIRGDFIAVYENLDMGHPGLGDVAVVSYGSSQAQLEVATAEELPVRLPDGLRGGQINWRYILKGVYTGDDLL